MYAPIRDEQAAIRVNIPWDKYTAIGFSIAVVSIIVVLLMLLNVEIDKPVVVDDERRIIPLELLNFGAGDGTGLSKGNLSKEGQAYKGSPITQSLQDASIAANTKKSNPSETDPELTNRLNPTSQLSSDQANKTKTDGSGTRNVGKSDGSLFGSGLGTNGTGSGAGYGLGDIEWGGGGNRTISYKVLPKYPNGANASQIKLRFTVAKDGTVNSITPAQKGGDPSLERAAREALRHWRFNPIKDEKEMWAIITFTFRLN